MDNQPSTSLPLGKLIFYGVGIATTSILLFGLIWIGLGQLNVNQASRLIAAVCVPPLILTFITLALYFRHNDTSSDT